MLYILLMGSLLSQGCYSAQTASKSHSWDRSMPAGACIHHEDTYLLAAASGGCLAVSSWTHHWILDQCTQPPSLQVRKQAPPRTREPP
jgi:hypothetical protein